MMAVLMLHRFDDATSRNVPFRRKRRAGALTPAPIDLLTLDAQPNTTSEHFKLEVVVRLISVRTQGIGSVVSGAMIPHHFARHAANAPRPSSVGHFISALRWRAMNIEAL